MEMCLTLQTPLAPAHGKLIPRDSCTDSCKLHVSPIADTIHFSSCNQRRLLRKRERKKERVNQNDPTILFV